MLTLEQVDSVIQEIFDDSRVKSIETVYEKAGDYYKLVFSFHSLEFDDVSVIHTKLIFPANLEKTGLTKDEFYYLRDINCVYERREFEPDNTESLKQALLEIFDGNDFGDDIKSLSKFNDYPSSIINNQLENKNVEDFSVFNVIYEPKFKISPCEDITFDFDININNAYNVNLSIEKEKNNDYNLHFKLNDIETINVSSLENIGEIIAVELIKIMEEIL